MKIQMLLKSLLLVLAALLSACDHGKEFQGVEYTPDTISKTKLCPDVFYNCLTETKDAQWQKKLKATRFSFTTRALLFMRLRSIEKTLGAHNALGKNVNYEGNRFHKLRDGVLDGKDSHKDTPDKGMRWAYDEAVTLAAKILSITEEAFLMDKTYQLSEREEKAIKERRKAKEYDEITQMLNLFHPNFWKDAPKAEQIQWVMQVEQKAENYNPKGVGRGTIEFMAMLCAMIGLDFETKPEYAPIVKYLSTIKEGNHGQLTQTVDYLHFTYLGWDYDIGGTYLTAWALSDALRHLPPPKRRVPRLSEDMPGGKMNHEEHNQWKVYEDTIYTGVK